MKKTQPENKVETPLLELAKPEEKLLRPPSFLEKYGTVKPIFIILIIIATLVFSIYYLLQTEKQYSYPNKPQPASTSINQTPVDNSGISDWKTYFSAQGQYSIKYPAVYTFDDSGISSNTIQLLSDVPEGLNTNFRITIRYINFSGNPTLQQLINQNPICEITSSQKGASGTINGEKQAQIYIDTPCGQYVQTVAYTMNNNILYIFTLESQAKFGEIKPFTDEIFAAFKFF